MSDNPYIPEICKSLLAQANRQAWKKESIVVQSRNFILIQSMIGASTPRAPLAPIRSHAPGKGSQRLCTARELLLGCLKVLITQAPVFL